MLDKLTKYISFILTLISAMPTIYGFFKNNLMVAYIFLALTIIFFILFIISLTFGHKSILFRRLMFICIKKPYIILERKLTYVCHANNVYSYTKDILLKCTQSGLINYDDKFSWSSNFNTTIKPLVNGQKVMNRTRAQGWENYTIHFERGLRKGETQRTGIILENLVDTNSQALPFISSNIYEPVQKLILRVEFQNNKHVAHAECRIYDNYFSTTPIQTQDITDTISDGILEYSLEYPVKGYRYQLNWEYNK